jgi:hypothetical protein
VANRDELGRFAAASTSPNGGGANFAPAAEVPNTRDALMKHATSQPSKAPTIRGGMHQAAPPPDYDKATNAVLAGHTGIDLGHSARHVVSDFAEQFESHFPGELSLGGAAPSIGECDISGGEGVGMNDF